MIAVTPVVETPERRTLFAAIGRTCGANGFWDDTANWSLARVPATGDGVRRWDRGRAGHGHAVGGRKRHVHGTEGRRGHRGREHVDGRRLPHQARLRGRRRGAPRLHLAHGRVVVPIDRPRCRRPRLRPARWLPARQQFHRAGRRVRQLYRLAVRLPGGDGARVESGASVVFDTNAAIVTNTTISVMDDAAPVGTVQALPATSLESFTVIWSGQDGSGSGFRLYDVFISRDGGTFTR